MNNQVVSDELCPIRPYVQPITNNRARGAMQQINIFYRIKAILKKNSNVFDILFKCNSDIIVNSQVCRDVAIQL